VTTGQFTTGTGAGLTTGSQFTTGVVPNGSSFLCPIASRIR
jgi:hypothetical protein